MVTPAVFAAGVFQCSSENRSEREADAGYHGSRLQEMGSAERRQEVVQGHFVGQVGDVYGRGQLLVLFRVEQVIGADAQVENVARLHAIGIVVVVLLAGLRQGDQLGFDQAAALGDGVVEGRKDTAAGQADRSLLRCRQPQGGIGIGNAADHQSAVVAPGQCDPLGGLVLVEEDTGRLECLVVVNPEHAAVQRSPLSDEAAIFREEVPGACMAEGPIGLEAAQVGGTDASCNSIEFRFVPGNGKGEGGVQQSAEVVSVVGVLPEVVRIHQQVLE